MPVYRAAAHVGRMVGKPAETPEVGEGATTR